MLRPIIKWAGGKTRLLPELLKSVPSHFFNYHEPFLGGGALFWHLLATDRISPLQSRVVVTGNVTFPRAFLSDFNPELIRMYCAVRDSVEDVIRHLGTMKNTREKFLEVRALHPSLIDNALAAARFLYLNKTCFNGLWRVNSRGLFNVPFGSYTNPTICDHENLRACSSALQRFRVHVSAGDFGSASGLASNPESASPGDLVYFDPPYPPLSKTSSFASYTKEPFGWAEHVKLHDLALTLKRAGVYVLLSNSNQPRVRELYEQSGVFTLREVSAPRSIAAKGGSRKSASELIIT
jgi:DNA adenine methylase